MEKETDVISPTWMAGQLEEGNVHLHIDYKTGAGM